jgi:hypothetical protein
MQLRDGAFLCGVKVVSCCMHWKALLYFVIIQDTIAHTGGAIASALREGIPVSRADPKRTLLFRKHLVLVKWRIFYQIEIRTAASKRNMWDSVCSILLHIYTAYFWFSYLFFLQQQY